MSMKLSRKPARELIEAYVSSKAQYLIWSEDYSSVSTEVLAQMWGTVRAQVWELVKDPIYEEIRS